MDSNELDEVTLKDEDVRFSLPSELVAAGDASPHHRCPMSPRQLHSAEALACKCNGVGARSVEALLVMRTPQGYWWADLTADTTLESDYILLQFWLHPPQNGEWNPPIAAPDG